MSLQRLQRWTTKNHPSYTTIPCVGGSWSIFAKVFTRRRPPRGLPTTWNLGRGRRLWQRRCRRHSKEHNTWTFRNWQCRWWWRHAPPLLDEFHKVERQVLKALGRGDALYEEADAEGLLHVENEQNLDIVDKLDGLYMEAITPVYRGSKLSVVSATIIIMKMCSVFSVSNTFTDELFHFLSRYL